MNAIESRRMMLLLRCPKISDPCRVTLMHFYSSMLFETKSSVAIMARVRGLTTQAIYNHIEEANKMRVVSVQDIPYKRISFLWDNMARLFGFGNEAQFIMRTAMEAPSSREDVDEQPVRENLLAIPKSAAEFCRYFKAKFQMASGIIITCDSKSVAIFRTVSRRYGATSLREMIDFFVEQRQRHGMPASVECFFRNADKIYRMTMDHGMEKKCAR